MQSFACFPSLYIVTQGHSLMPVCRSAVVWLRLSFQLRLCVVAFSVSVVPSRAARRHRIVVVRPQAIAVGKER